MSLSLGRIEDVSHTHLFEIRKWERVSTTQAKAGIVRKTHQMFFGVPERLRYILLKESRWTLDNRAISLIDLVADLAGVHIDFRLSEVCLAVLSRQRQSKASKRSMRRLYVRTVTYSYCK